MIEGIELPKKKKKRKKSECPEKRKLTNIWEYWKRTPLNIRRRKKKELKKSISGERGNYWKPNYIGEIVVQP